MVHAVPIFVCSIVISFCFLKECEWILTDDEGNGAKYSGVMYLSPTAEIIALLFDDDKALMSVSSRLIEFLVWEVTLVSEADSLPFSIWFLLSSSTTLFCFLLAVEEVFWAAGSSKIVMRKYFGEVEMGTSLFHDQNYYLHVTQ